MSKIGNFFKSVVCNVGQAFGRDKCPSPFAADIAAQQAVAVKPVTAQTHITPLPPLDIVKTDVPATPAAPAKSYKKHTVIGLIAAGALTGLIMVANKNNQQAPPEVPGVTVPTDPIPPKFTPPVEPPKVDPPKVEEPKVVVPEPPKVVTPVPKPVDPACSCEGKSLVKKEITRLIWVKEPRRFVGQYTGKIVTRYVWVRKAIKQTVYVPAPVQKPVEPPKPPVVTPPVIVTPPVVTPPVVVTPPPAVNTGTRLIGFKGLGGIFDKKAFEQFAQELGYIPVVIDPWDKTQAINEAIDKLGNFKDPYAIYGFSMGGETAKDFIETVKKLAANGKSSAMPVAAFTIGTSQVVSFKNAFDGIPTVQFFFHEGTKHDVDGTFIKAPHTGTGNIQQVVADKFKKG